MKKLFVAFLISLMITTLFPWSVFAITQEIPANGDTFIAGGENANQNYNGGTTTTVWAGNLA